MGERRHKIVTVPEWGGRDAGKLFVVRERDALSIERWGWKVIVALKGTTAQIPETLISMGAVGPMLILIRGMNSFLAADVDKDVIIALVDELLPQVKIIRDPSVKDKLTGTALETDVTWEGDHADIDEAKTITWLRGEVLSLEINFSILDALLKLSSALKVPDTSLTAPTSPLSSTSLSPADGSPSGT